MPLIFPAPDETAAELGVDAIAVRRHLLASGSILEIARRDDEVLLYVISGTGSARVGDEDFTLAPESVLWLEPGDACVLHPSEDHLEVLESRAR